MEAALKSIMASPKRLLEAVGEYVAERVVGPVPTMSLAMEESQPPAAAPATAIKRQSTTAPVAAGKRQSVAAPVAAVKRQSVSPSAKGGGVKKTSPGSKKGSPVKTVKAEPARELPIL